MSSEGNKVNDGTSYQPSEPILCANGCGFFGQAATNNLCSKCYRDLRIHEEKEASAKASVDKLVDKFSTRIRSVKAVDSVVAAPPSASATGDSSSDGGVAVAEEAKVKAANRCLSCRKKVGVLGFKCKCGSTFCGEHRYPEKHECSYDFKAVGKEGIAQANPVIKADKIQRF